MLKEGGIRVLVDILLAFVPTVFVSAKNVGSAKPSSCGSLLC